MINGLVGDQYGRAGMGACPDFILLTLIFLSIIKIPSNTAEIFGCLNSTVPPFAPTTLNILIMVGILIEEFCANPVNVNVAQLIPGPRLHPKSSVSNRKIAGSNFPPAV